LINNNLIPITFINNKKLEIINNLQEIIENNNYDSQLILDNTNIFDNNIFNYIGIINVNFNNIIDNGSLTNTSIFNIGLNLPFDLVINTSSQVYTFPSLITKNPSKYINLNNLLNEYNPEYYIRLLYLYDYSIYNHYILKIKDIANLTFINTFYYAWIYPQENISSIYQVRIINNINTIILPESFIFDKDTQILTFTLDFDYNLTNNTIIRIANNKQSTIFEDVQCTLITNFKFSIKLTNPGLYLSLIHI
jgi:hypothetical protein